LEHRDCYDIVISYDALREDPATAVKSLFELLNIEKEHLEDALKPKQKDSQGSVFKKGINTAERRFLTNDQVLEVNSTLAALGLPFRADMGREEFEKIVNSRK